MRLPDWRRIAVGAAVTLLAGGIVAVPSPAAAEEKCPRPEKQVSPGKVSESKLWAQELLDVKRVWPVTKGAGATVAVIDSGVDKDLDLLDGRVKPGKAWIKNTKDEKAKGGDDARADCDGHGTEVAGIIAASEDPDSGFHGIAPEAEIIPYRIANQRPGDESQASTEDTEEGQKDPTVTEDDFADAISAAVDDDVDVINMSVKYSHDFDSIKSAVKKAVDAGIVVVAAAGNNGLEANPKPTYPANYEGVIGVGAVDKNESRVPSSQVGPWVDVVAPGANLAAPLPNGKYETNFGGTSGATPFVSGTAALLVAQHSGDDAWTGAKIAEQIMATAAPTAGGTGMAGQADVEGNLGVSNAYGHGRVDPYSAVTQTMNTEAIEKMEMDAPKADPAAVERNADFAKMRSWALWVGLGALAVFTAALAGVGALRRGKTSKWNIKRVDKSQQLETFDDGDPIPIFQGIKGLKE